MRRCIGRLRNTLLGAAALTIISLSATYGQAQEPSATEARAIAKEAYIYGYPVVDNYRIQHAYFVDTKNTQYMGPFNSIKNIARVYTPKDTAIQTPNSDTPYSLLGMDLRAEPLVLTVPVIEKTRYFSVQLIDAYTFNFDYIGSRTTGNDGGSFMVAGPGWHGDIPKGIRRVFYSDTDFVLALYRTQLFNPNDLNNVKKIQAHYRVEPLSAFLGQTAPKAAPKVDFIKPLPKAKENTSLEFFNILNFVLNYCPTVPSEKELMQRFAKINVGAGKAFDVATLSLELRKAIAEGIADAWKELDTFVKTSIDTGKVTSGDLFGTRKYMKNNYLYRFAAAELGIYGNSKQEAMYPVYRTDADGRALDAAMNRYTLYFPKGQLPPVNAFWSLTMYKLPSSLLVANSLDRYLINSSMIPDLKSDGDGGLMIYLQHESPGAAKESNWLPAPKGPFTAVLRLYWPKQETLDGRWKSPLMKRVE